VEERHAEIRRRRSRDAVAAAVLERADDVQAAGDGVIRLDAGPGAGRHAEQQQHANQQIAYADADHDCPPATVVSRMRHTSSSKSMPTACAAIGTSECEVMPGAAFISRNHGWPAWSSMKSSRPQPRPPTTSKALW